MHHRVTAPACLLISLILFTLNTQAIGIGARASTMGFGLELTLPIANKINTRFGYNAFNFATSTTDTDIKYDIDLKLNNFEALLDWHPWTGGFRLTGGVFLNQNSFSLTGTDSDNVNIGETTFVGTFTVQGTLAFRRVSPYLGIGWGMRPNKKTGLSFSTEFGVFFQGEPSVNLNATGFANKVTDGVVDDSQIDVSENPEFIEAIAQEEGEIQNDLKVFNIYPLLSMGLSYTF